MVQKILFHCRTQNPTLIIFGPNKIHVNTTTTLYCKFCRIMEDSEPQKFRKFVRSIEFFFGLFKWVWLIHTQITLHKEEVD